MEERERETELVGESSGCWWRDAIQEDTDHLIRQEAAIHEHVVSTVTLSHSSYYSTIRHHAHLLLLSSSSPKFPLLFIDLLIMIISY